MDNKQPIDRLIAPPLRQGAIASRSMSETPSIPLLRPARSIDKRAVHAISMLLHRGPMQPKIDISPDIRLPQQVPPSRMYHAIAAPPLSVFKPARIQPASAPISNLNEYSVRQSKRTTPAPSQKAFGFEVQIEVCV